MNELKRHRRVFTILLPFVKIFMKWKFHYVYDDLKQIQGPYLLLANHNLELDPAAVGVAAGKQLYFVASEHIMRKGIGTRLLMWAFKPIIHKKGKQGAYTVKEMMKALKAGNSVCIFPEGNRSFNGLTGSMMPAIGKMARRCGAGLITYRLEGGYLTQPRWSVTLRKGKLRGRLMHVYSGEELSTMTDEQVNQMICEDLFEDAYGTQKRERVAFRGKNLALGLETTIFICPDCGQIGTLHSEGNRFYCDCGFHAVYDVYGELTDGAGKKYTITELDRKQQETLRKRAAGEGREPIFSDTVTLYEIDSKHSILRREEGSLQAYRDRIECCGHTFSYVDMEGMAIYSRNFMVIHMEGGNGHFEIQADKRFCALKYLYLYQTKEEVQ